jgi:hypothetical protein
MAEVTREEKLKVVAVLDQAKASRERFEAIYEEVKGRVLAAQRAGAFTASPMTLAQRRAMGRALVETRQYLTQARAMAQALSAPPALVATMVLQQEQLGLLALALLETDVLLEDAGIEVL